MTTTYKSKLAKQKIAGLGSSDFYFDKNDLYHYMKHMIEDDEDKRTYGTIKCLGYMYMVGGDETHTYQEFLNFLDDVAYEEVPKDRSYKVTNQHKFRILISVLNVMVEKFLNVDKKHRDKIDWITLGNLKAFVQNYTIEDVVRKLNIRYKNWLKEDLVKGFHDGDKKNGKCLRKPYRKDGLGDGIELDIKEDDEDIIQAEYQ